MPPSIFTRLSGALYFPLLMAVSVGVVRADTIYLKNGNTIEGEVVREDRDAVVVRLVSGELSVRAADVEVIERVSPLENRIELGKRFLAAEKPERAIQEFEHACVLDKNSTATRTLLADALWAQSKRCCELNLHEDARNALNRLLNLDPKAQLVAHTAVALLEKIGGQPQPAAGVPGVKSRPEITTQMLLKRAAQRAENGDSTGAVADIEAAMRLDPSQAAAFERLYCQYALIPILHDMDAGDLAAAEKGLAAVLLATPKNKYVLYAAGRLQEKRDDPAGAADRYAAGLGTRAANPTPEYVAELRRRLEQEVRREGYPVIADVESKHAAQFPGTAQKLETENFIFLHFDDAVAQEVAPRAEADRARVIAATNFKPWFGKAKFYIYRSEGEFTARTGQPHWVGGFAFAQRDSQNRVVVEIHTFSKSLRLLSGTIPHEIAHGLIHANTKNIGFLPACLNEGLAVTMEPRVNVARYKEILKGRMHTPGYIPLSKLLTTRSYPADPDIFYAQSAMLVEFLSEQKGLPEVIKMIVNTPAAHSVPDEMLRMTGSQTVDELEVKWKNWIETTPIKMNDL